MFQDLHLGLFFSVDTGNLCLLALFWSVWFGVYDFIDYFKDKLVEKI